MVAEVPIDRLFHAVPRVPTRSEMWLYLMEQLGIAGPCGGPRAGVGSAAWTSVVAGGHGKIGLRLLRLLAERGHRGTRADPQHRPRPASSPTRAPRPVLCDIEELDDLSGCCAGADAVVFAAGAGPGSGAERKRTVDYGAAVKLMDAGVPDRATSW